MSDERALDDAPSTSRGAFMFRASSINDMPMATTMNNDDQNLSPTEKQVLSIAMRYDTLREGEWWYVVLKELQQDNVHPIEADTNLLEERRENVFEATRTVQFEQMELAVQKLSDKKMEEDVFIDHILQQKNQQIKSEWLKKKALFNKTTSTMMARTRST